LAARATVLDLDGIAVRVAALDDVIASKERADRPKDRAALEELRTLRQPGVGGEEE
jgi:predicted nucleotidyltransferase